MGVINKYQQSILVDTNVVSYAVSPPTDRDSDKILGHKEYSRKLFNSLKNFNLFISSTVVKEISRGNPGNVKKRKNQVYDIEVLVATPEINELTDDFMREGVFRPKARNDALILAAACFYGIDYLITCNMKDLANAKKLKEMIRIAEKHGYHPPTICTPNDFLMNYMNKPREVRDESVNYFDKSQNLSYNMDTMKAIEYEEESILEECRRIRRELDEEYAKDPKKYMDNLYREQEEMKAQGFKFAPVPPTPPWIKEYMQMCKERRGEATPVKQEVSNN